MCAEKIANYSVREAYYSENLVHVVKKSQKSQKSQRIHKRIADITLKVAENHKASLKAENLQKLVATHHNKISINHRNLVHISTSGTSLDSILPW